MKIEEKTVTIYVSDDGAEFFNMYQCQAHEENIKFERERKEFLTTILKKLLPGDVEVEVVNLTGDHTVELYSDYYGSGEFEEFDECMDSFIKMHRWHEIQYEMKLKYGFNATIPTWYWGK